MFTVTVLDPCANGFDGEKLEFCSMQVFHRDVTPAWLGEVSDQVIVFGEDWKYRMGRPIDNYGNYIDVSAKLSEELDKFTIFSSKFNNVKITGEKMEHVDIPRYHYTIFIDFIDVFGLQQSFKKDI